MAVAQEILGALLGDSTVLRRLGREIANGMREGGNSVGYSSTTPSGGDANRGVAGGRGDPKELSQSIRASQLQRKAQEEIVKDYGHLSKELNEHRKTVSKTTDDIDVFSRVFTSKWTNVLDSVRGSQRVERILKNRLARATGREINSMEDVLALREEQLSLERQIKAQEGYENQQTRELVQQYKQLSTILNAATNHLTSFSDTLETGFKRTVRGFFSFEAALTNASIALAQLTNDFRAQLKFGSQMGLWNSQMQALIKGVDPGEFTEMMGRARQVSLAFGDVKKFSELMTQKQREFYRFIGDTTEATRFVTDSFVTLGRAGIRPTTETIDAMGHSFKFLNTIAGVTSDQFQGMMDGVLQETDIREKLRAAQDGERAAIVAGIAQQIKMNVAMGMTVEQATEAAKSLGRLAGGGAKERFKQAAQVQMIMGGMGVAGGADAADLIRKGQRRTSEENTRLQGYMSQIANDTAESKRGGYGAELMVDTMMDKTGMGQFLGKDSAFVTTLTSALVPQKEQLDAANEELKRQTNLLERGLYWWDLSANFVANGALGKLLVSTAQLIGAFVLGKMAVGAIGGLGAMGSVVATAGRLGVGGLGLGTAAVGGVAVGTAINQAPTLLGFDSISTNIVDGLERLFGADYDPNKGVEEAIQQRKEAHELQEKQLAAQERANELAQLSLEFQQGSIDLQEMNHRLQMLNIQSQPQMLATGP